MSSVAIERSALGLGVPEPSRLNGRSLAVAAAVTLFGAALAHALSGPGDVVNAGGWPSLVRFARAALHPDLSGPLLALAASSAVITFAFAFCGTALSVLIGSVVGLLSSQVYWRARAFGGQRERPYVMWLAVRVACALPRAVHEVIWGLLLIGIVGLDPVAAVLAIAIPFGLITGKVYSEILDETPRKTMDALLAAGATPLRAFVYGLLPSALPYLLTYALYRLECAIRTAAILGLIGAGGLGYQILISLQSLRYEQVWLFLYALMALVGLADAWGSLLARRLNVNVRAELRNSAASGPVLSSHAAVRGSLIATAVLLPLCFYSLGADVGRLVSPDTFQRLLETVRSAWPPRVDAAQLALLTKLTLQTLGMSVLAIGMAGVGGLILSFPASTTLTLSGGVFTRDRGGLRWLRVLVLAVVRGALLAARSMSDAIWALVLLFVFFPGVWPGALALGVYNMGVLGRLMSQVNESADTRPMRALQAQGASAAQILLYGLLPASLPKCIGYVMYRWEVCVRATVVVGVVGAGGLGQLLEEQLAAFDYRSVATTLAFYVALTLFVDLLSSVVRRAVKQGRS